MATDNMLSLYYLTKRFAIGRKRFQIYLNFFVKVFGTITIHAVYKIEIAKTTK